jgi:C1A family cysteine protease
MVSSLGFQDQVSVTSFNDMTINNQYDRVTVKPLENECEACYLHKLLIDPDPNGVFDSPKPAIIDTPEEFSWTDYNGKDWTTPVRDQGICGSCWLFATFGAIESVIEIKEGYPDLNPDLSEQYVLSCIPKAGSCDGGVSSDAFRYIMNYTLDGTIYNGIIFESCLRYQENDDVPCSEKCDHWRDTLVPLLNWGKWHTNPEDREAIKTQIMQGGPVVAYFMATYEFSHWMLTHNNPADYYPYPGEVSGTNHEVVIVGWKNDASIGNGGYWICKNSWGPKYGYNGFFNVEYGSLNLDDSTLVWVDYDPENFNWPPIAIAGEVKYGTIHEELHFDASQSYDLEGAIEVFHWDFGDGTGKDGAIVTHAYSEQGIYQVTVTITDIDNKSWESTTWAFIDVENQPPEKPIIAGPHHGAEMTFYNYTFATTDPNGDDVYLYIDWGCGQLEDWIGPFKSGEEVTWSNRWFYHGAYTIQAKARDIYGNESDWATLRITMPYSYDIPVLLFWEKLFERLPYAFPMLQFLKGY